MAADLHIPYESLPAQGAVEQLIVLVHGWASTPEDLMPLAAALRQQFPQAALIAPLAPHATDGGRRGRMWYSIEGLLEDRSVWPQRVAGVVELLTPWVEAQQQRLVVGRPATALAGFSQGGIVAMAMALAHDGLVGRVLSFGGTLVQPPQRAPEHTTLHLFHGSEDRIIPTEGSRQALEHFNTLGGDATLDIAHGIGHELHASLIECALQRLRTHIPQRTWRAALGAVPSDGVASGGVPGGAMTPGTAPAASANKAS